MLKKILRNLTLILTVALCALILFACTGGPSGGEQHVWSAWTFEDRNVHQRVCSVCNEVERESHNFENGVCSDCGYKEEPAIIRNVLDATVDQENLSVNMFIRKSVSSLNLSNSVTTSENCVWKLYNTSNVLIPTKRIEPYNGNNTYLIVVSSTDGVYENTYEFTVYKSFEVTVSYYGVYNDLLKAETVDTGYEYSVDFVPSIVGYTFEHWKKEGEATEKFTPYKSTRLFAECRANSYELSLDVNGGEALEKETQNITFDSEYTLPTPTREGHTFLGWFDGENKVNISGNSKFAKNSSLSAKWQINKYKVTLAKNGDYPTTLTGSGTYDYGTSVTVSATMYLGYEWAGWYDGETRLTDKLSYTFTLGAHDVTVIAKIGIKSEMQNFEFTSNETTCTVTGLNDKTIKSISIPDYVTSIGASAFSGCSSLTSIEIPSSVTSIGSSAFSGCSSLTSVTFDVESKLTSIGNSAFSDCGSLTSIEIPSSATSIGASAFGGCSSLTSIEIPNGVTSIGASAFGGSSRLTIYCESESKLSGWDSDWNYNNPVVWNCKSNNKDQDGYEYALVNNIRYKFKDKTAIVIEQSVNITEARIPDTVFYNGELYNITSIGSSAFEGCSNLTSIKLPFVGATPNGTEDTHFGYIFGASTYNDNSKCVPASLKTVTIADGNSISDYALFGCSSLTSIEIPSSVTGIGDSAFNGCSGLTSIEIPNGVTSIGSSAFEGCSNLTSIKLPFVGATLNGTEDTHFGYIFGASTYNDNSKYVPASLKTATIADGSSIGSSAFYGCSGLTSIEIPNSVTSIGYRAFYGCSSLTSIEIPSDVTSIGSSAFYGCSSLTSIEIPSGVTSIGYGTFYGCSSLTSIEIPSDVTSIGRSAFEGCSNLTSITLPFVGVTLNGTEDTHFGYIFGADTYYANSEYVPASLKTVTIAGGNSIGENAFDFCRSLISIEIPSSVTSIGKYAFYCCSSLTSIEIPSGVTSIGYEAFYGCSGLTSITLPFVGATLNGTENTHFGYIFGTYTNNSEYVPASLKTVTIAGGNSIGYSAFENCSGLTRIEIPSSVTSIGDRAFSGCSGLTSIEIPSGVTSIGDRAFRGCSGLESMTVASGNTKYHSDGNCIIETESKTLVAGCKNSIIPSDGSVTSIGYRAFYGCSSLTSIEIPSGVTSIGQEAFSGCGSLTSIEIPSSVTSIGNYAFENCSSLTDIEIPSSVTSIGDRAFRGCSGLESMTVASGNTKYHSDGNCIIRTGSKTLVAGCKNSIIPSDGSVTSIGNYAFGGCSGLTSVVIPSSVTSIGYGAFNGCSGLESIEIPSSVTSIGYSAFENCSSLTSIEIPSGVTSIGESTFRGCSGLESIEIPSSVTSIGYSAFENCSGLTRIEIPSGVTSIGQEAFSGCSKLTIYCEAASKPSGWNSDWNNYNCPVVWGYKG